MSIFRVWIYLFWLWVVPYSGQADLCQGLVDVLGWHNALLPSPACITRSGRDVLPLLVNVSAQGLPKVKKTQGEERRD